MDREVREVICNHCSHRYVCVYKDNYLDMINKLENLFYSIPENKREVISFTYPSCKFYQTAISERRTCQMTGIKLPEAENYGIKSPEELFSSANE